MMMSCEGAILGPQRTKGTGGVKKGEGDRIISKDQETKE